MTKVGTKCPGYEMTWYEMTGNQLPIKRIAKILIRLGGCRGSNNSHIRCTELYVFSGSQYGADLVEEGG